MTTKQKLSAMLNSNYLMDLLNLSTTQKILVFLMAGAYSQKEIDVIMCNHLNGTTVPNHFRDIYIIINKDKKSNQSDVGNITGIYIKFQILAF